MRKCLLTDPKIVRISSALGADRFRTVGGIYSAWCLFDSQTADGMLDGYTPEIFDELLGFPGLAAAMATVDWLEIGHGFLAVPRFGEHNGQTAKRRAQESVRKMSARDAGKRAHSERKKSGPEKRREEKSTSLRDVPPNPQGGDGLFSDGGTLDLVGIVQAYPRREGVAEALGHLAASIRKGADPSAVLGGTRAIASVIAQMPSGALNAYVVSAATFFRNERWRDDPETWKRHGTGKNGAAKAPLNLGGRCAGETIRVNS